MEPQLRVHPALMVSVADAAVAAVVPVLLLALLLLVVTPAATLSPATKTVHGSRALCAASVST
jgi:hypothetical protein